MQLSKQSNKSKVPLVINLWGGAGSGKSTTASGLFFLLKTIGYNVELVTEWIKSKVYEGSSYVRTDGLYVFAKQNKALREIGNQQDIIITDSPLPLGNLYDPGSETLQALRWEVFNSYNNLNILIRRDGPYQQAGRFQTEAEALEIDKKLYNMLLDQKVSFVSVCGNTNAPKVILEVLRVWNPKV